MGVYRAGIRPEKNRYMNSINKYAGLLRVFLRVPGGTAHSVCRVGYIEEKIV
jgi:hypothetical protein